MLGTVPVRFALASDERSVYLELTSPAESAMSSQPPVIHSDAEILGGTPVFVGTRVPARALIDYLEGGHPLDEFLDDFPSVSREQAIAALELAREALLRVAAA